MDDAYDVPDSTDWLGTPLKDLATVENCLHCQICKEFYDTPMITTCNHTFCSKCIRTSLSADGKCPACRAQDQANKLRNNWALQEVVSSFLAARPAVLDVAHQAQEANTSQRPGKRKWDAASELNDVKGTRNLERTTRSKSRRIAASQLDTREIAGSEEEEELRPEPTRSDGLVECPLGCGKYMKEEQVFGHLDKCEDEQKQSRLTKSQRLVSGAINSRSGQNHNTTHQDRINELNYSMMKDLALSRKLKDIGIPHFGSKQLMTSRHKEWVNIWNANCDSHQPRSRRDLLRDLDIWERTQGGKAPNANGISSTIMRKDFDGDAYSKRHHGEFSRLIADARRKKNIPTPVSSSPKTAPRLDNITETRDIHKGTGTSSYIASSSPISSASPHKDPGNSFRLDGSLGTTRSDPRSETISSSREQSHVTNRGDDVPQVSETSLEDSGSQTAPTLLEFQSSSARSLSGVANDDTIHNLHTVTSPPKPYEATPQVLSRAASLESLSREGTQSEDDHLVDDKIILPCGIAP